MRRPCVARPTELASEPGAPEGLRLQASPALQKIQGQGELWINPDGLPIRQVLDIEMPEASANYATRVHMVVDLSAYGRVEALPRAVQDASGAGVSRRSAVGVARRHEAGGRRRFAAPRRRRRGERCDGRSASRRRREHPAGRAAACGLPPSSVALFGLAVLALVAWRYLRAGARRSPRRGTRFLATILIPVIVLGPLLQAGRIVRFTERTT